MKQVDKTRKYRLLCRAGLLLFSLLISIRVFADSPICEALFDGSRVEEQIIEIQAVKIELPDTQLPARQTPDFNQTLSIPRTRPYITYQEREDFDRSISTLASLPRMIRDIFILSVVYNKGPKAVGQELGILDMSRSDIVSNLRVAQLAISRVNQGKGLARIREYSEKPLRENDLLKMISLFQKIEAGDRIGLMSRIPVEYRIVLGRLTDKYNQSLSGDANLMRDVRELGQELDLGDSEVRYRYQMGMFIFLTLGRIEGLVNDGLRVGVGDPAPANE